MPETPPTETPPTGTPPVETPSGLPSDQPSANAYDGFTLNDDQKALFKDGKLNGRFTDLNGVLEKLKESEYNYANLVRDKTTATATTQQQQDDAKKASDKAALQTSTVNEMIPAFIANGMQLTPEMEKTATEAGIDIRDLKLGAIEIRERTTLAHRVVGGKDNYDAMIAWGRTAMSPEQQASFDKDVTSGMGEYAIKGLFNDFTDAQESGDTPRFTGTNAVGGITPYADRRELYKDKEYVESPAGRRDTAAVRNYRARLKATPDKIVFGRR